MTAAGSDDCVLSPDGVDDAAVDGEQMINKSASLHSFKYKLRNFFLWGGSLWILIGQNVGPSLCLPDPPPLPPLLLGQSSSAIKLMADTPASEPPPLPPPFR